MPRKKKTILVEDGDILAYVIGFACERSTVEFKNPKTGHSLNVKNRSEIWNLFKGLLSKEQINEFFEIQQLTVAEPLENALRTVKVIIDKDIAACKATEVEVYISGKDNFRDNIPLPKKYKWNREGKPKPVLLPEIMNFLITQYGAKVTKGYEADDVLSIRAYDGVKNKTKVIQSTIDKDANQCTGYLYNRDKMVEPEKVNGFGELYLDDKGEVRGKGRIWLYYQVLYGDTSDGYHLKDIAGIKGYGEKAAYNDLKDCTNDQEALQVLHDKAKEWYPTPVTYTAWDGKEYTKSYVQILQMYLDCARMLRWEGDKVNIVDLFRKHKVRKNK